MNRYQRFFFLHLSFLAAVGLASAEVVEYQVQVDTTSISGTAGSLDFQFNPGPLLTQSASLQILDFSTSGILADNPVLTGDVSGLLAATISFDNGSAFNDYSEGFTFGATLSFDVSLLGPALTSPDGISTSGSTFAFSMFSDASGTIPTLTSDTTDGFAFTADVNLDGSTTVANFSSETSVVAETSAVPEPSSLELSLIVAALTFALVRTQRHRTQRRLPR